MRWVQSKPLLLFKMVPFLPTATSPFGKDSTEERNVVAGVGRLVQITASGLVKIVPAPPLATNRLPKAVMPWRSSVVGGGTACQTRPNVLTWFVAKVPSVLVLTTD